MKRPKQYYCVPFGRSIKAFEEFAKRQGAELFNQNGFIIAPENYLVNVLSLRDLNVMRF